MTIQKWKVGEAWVRNVTNEYTELNDYHPIANDSYGQNSHLMRTDIENGEIVVLIGEASGLGGRVWSSVSKSNFEQARFIEKHEDDIEYLESDIVQIDGGVGGEVRRWYSVKIRIDIKKEGDKDIYITTMNWFDEKAPNLNSNPSAITGYTWPNRN